MLLLVAAFYRKKGIEVILRCCPKKSLLLQTECISKYGALAASQYQSLTFDSVLVFLISRKLGSHKTFFIFASSGVFCFKCHCAVANKENERKIS